jgi:hypothetical protein
MGGGVAAVDYNNDGFIDLFVANGEGQRSQLYRNNGDGTFIEVGASVGLTSTVPSRIGLFFDYDGDGRLDLAVLGDCFNGECDPKIHYFRLYRQTEAGQFVDVTAAAGLTDASVTQSGTHAAGLAAGDIDNDGYLDLMITYWGEPDRLYHNRGDGTFHNISVSSGVGVRQEKHWQPVFHDFNGDGWQDIFVAVDFTENLLWINNGDLTFTDIAAAAGVDTAYNEMGVTLGDFDNDGDLDIYVTNVFEAIPGARNVLFRNDSTPEQVRFTEVSREMGVDNGYWGWGTTFTDCDNDGWLDLAATNGFMEAPWTTDPSKFWTHPGVTGAPYVDVSVEVGFADTDWGSGLVTADLDRDGDLDLIQTCFPGGPLRLLMNQRTGAAAARRALVIQPRMSGPNRYAVGAIVRAANGNSSQMRLISAGTSFMSQEPYEAFFGLRNEIRVDLLTIEWPDGARSVFTNVPIYNQPLQVWRRPGDLNCDGRVDFDDIDPFVTALISAEDYRAAYPNCDRSNADTDANRSIDFNDIEGFIATLVG